jgi:hypothetical protein
MNTRYFAITAAMCFALIAVGCQSARATRIKENAALFASLDPFTQKVIQQGFFAHGFTPELTYLSLGKPNQKTVNETGNGSVEVWKYRNFVYGNVAGAMKMSANTPGSKPYGPILSSSAPGGPSLFSTKAGPMQPTVSDGSDVPVGTLYIEFLNGRIVAARLDP